MKGLRGLVGALAVIAVLGGSACSGGDSSDGGPTGESADTGDSAATDTDPSGSMLTSDGPRFIEPTNGDEVTSPVLFRIDPGPVDLTGASVPADSGGRFHLLIDQGCLPNAAEIPVGEPGHVAFDREATDVIADLEVGAHEVCLQFGNGFDVAFYATDTITIRVIE